MGCNSSSIFDVDSDILIKERNRIYLNGLVFVEDETPQNENSSFFSCEVTRSCRCGGRMVLEEVHRDGEEGFKLEYCNHENRYVEEIKNLKGPLPVEYSNVLIIGEPPGNRFHETDTVPGIDFGKVAPNCFRNKRLLIRNFEKESVNVTVLSVPEEIGFTLEHPSTSLKIPGFKRDGPRDKSRKVIELRYSNQNPWDTSQVKGYLCLRIDLKAPKVESSMFFYPSETPYHYSQTILIPLFGQPKEEEEEGEEISLKLDKKKRKKLERKLIKETHSNRSDEETQVSPLPKVLFEEEIVLGEKPKSEEEEEEEEEEVASPWISTENEEEVEEKKKKNTGPPFHILASKIFLLTTVERTDDEKSREFFLSELSLYHEFLDKENLDEAISERTEMLSTISLLEYMLYTCHHRCDQYIEKITNEMETIVSDESKRNALGSRLEELDYIRKKILSFITKTLSDSQEGDDGDHEEVDPIMHIMETFLYQRRNSWKEQRILKCLSQVLDPLEDEIDISRIFWPIISGIRDRSVLLDFTEDEKQADNDEEEEEEGEEEEEMVMTKMKQEDVRKRLFIFLDWASKSSKLRRLIVTHPSFLGVSSTQTPCVEEDSFFGPFLKLSTYFDSKNRDLATLIFEQPVTTTLEQQKKQIVDPKNKSKGIIVPRLIERCRSRQRQMLKEMKKVFSRFLIDTGTRSHFFRFFEHTIRCNEMKSKLVDQQMMSMQQRMRDPIQELFERILGNASDNIQGFGFLLNMNYIILDIFIDLIDKGSQKKNKKKNLEDSIDGTFAMTSHIGFQELAKMGIEVSVSKKEYEKVLDELQKDEVDFVESTNFMTRMFYTTMRMTNLGLITAQRMDQNILSEEMKSATEKGDVKKIIELVTKKASNEVIIQDPDFNDMCRHLYRFNQRYMLHLLSEPPEPPPLVFRWQPETFVGDMIDHFKYLYWTLGKVERSVGRRKKLLDQFLNDRCSNFIELLILIMENSGFDTSSSSSEEKNTKRMNYLTNYNEVVRIVEVITDLCPREGDGQRRRRGLLSSSYSLSKIHPFYETLLKHPRSRKKLIYCLMKTYVDIEKKMSQNRRLPPRAKIMYAMTLLWNYEIFKKSLGELAKKVDDPQLTFIKFIDLNLTDISTYLEECLLRLNQIHSFEKKQNEGEQQEQEQREEEEGENEEETAEQEEEGENQMNRGYVRGNLGHAELSLHMLNLISREYPLCLDRPYLVERIAVMLDQFLVKLVINPHQLKVSGGVEKLNFRPRELLMGVVETFLNLSELPSFIRGVKRDVRSFETHKDLFSKTVHLIEKRKISSKVLSRFMIRQKFEEFQVRLDELVDVWAEIDAASTRTVLEMLEPGEPETDVPDRFVCMIGGNLMEDPVEIKVEGEWKDVVMDRKTVIQLVVKPDAKNPYTRGEIRMEDVRPREDLKNEILEYVKKWKEERKKEEKVEEEEEEKEEEEEEE